MPLIIDDKIIQQEFSNQNICDPKFFSELLTGNNGARGVLRKEKNPAMIRPLVPIDFFGDCPIGVSSWSNGNTKTRSFTTAPIPENIYRMNDYRELEFTLPKSEFIEIGNIYDSPLYLRVIPYAFQFDETYTELAATARSNYTVYQVFLWCAPKTQFSLAYYCGDAEMSESRRQFDNRFCTKLTLNPKSYIENWVKNMEGRIPRNSFMLNQSALDQYFDSYVLYDQVCALSEQWQKRLPELAEQLFMDIKFNSKRMCGNTELEKGFIKCFCEHISSYATPLIAFIQIYNLLEKHFDESILKEACRSSLNLLQTRSLDELNKNRHLCPHLSSVNPKPALDPVFSLQQQKAIQSESPFVMIQAVAGSGKSSTILGRIKYMKDCGIPSDEITILSFTNAAADHIHDIDPELNSMTFDKFISKIYQNNFPDQRISSPMIVANNLKIFFPYDDDMQRFGTLICGAQNSKDILRLKNFIEDNLTDCIKALNTIRQTTLEVQTIISYLLAEQLSEPDGRMITKHLIVDEVQDNSMLQLIYTLKYTLKSKCSLFIVGDCSQTLYEFRNANPKMLNILEASGVFDTYPLTTNFRSRKEILEFANLLLSDIDANRFAQLRLNANSLTPITKQSFSEAVALTYIPLDVSSRSRWTDYLPAVCQLKIKPYIDKCLSKNEKVAVLTRYTGKEAKPVFNMLSQMYPNKKVIDCTPPKQSEFQIFSSFLVKCGSHFETLSLSSYLSNLSDSILNSLSKRQQKIRSLVASWINEWISKYDSTINEWIKMVNNQTLKRPEFNEQVRDLLLNYEVSKCQIQNYLQNNRKQIPDEDADIIVSTVHSAKGLEYDHVICLMEHSNIMDEEEKRVYYVAVTRACKSLYIIAHDSVKYPKIGADYTKLLDSLPDQQSLAAAS